VKKNADEAYEFLYSQLESLKEICSNRVLPILDFCQECITYSGLKYLPDEVELRSDTVIFSYEEDNGDHLLVSFTKQGFTFDDAVIECVSFKKDNLQSYHSLSWNNTLKFIDDWFIL
jgi:hypothetical protein